MKVINKFNRFVIYLKNRQLRLEREKRRALAEQNSILSAYVAILIEEKGEARISRKLIRSTIGNYSAKASLCGDDYLISIVRCGERGVKANNKWEDEKDTSRTSK